MSALLPLRAAMANKAEQAAKRFTVVEGGRRLTRAHVDQMAENQARDPKRPLFLLPPGVSATKSVPLMLNALLPDKQAERIAKQVGALPKAVLRRLMAFEATDVHEQPAIIREIEQHGLPVRDALSVASVTRKLTDPRYGEHSERFIDPSVHRLTKGHEIEMVVEVPLDGVSRGMTDFFESVLRNKSAEVIGLDESHPGIQRLQLQTDSVARRKLPKKQLEDEPADKVVPVTGKAGLLRLFQDNPDHPGFIDQDTMRESLGRALASKYGYELLRGVVAEPPGYTNGGVLKLDDGTEVQMTNIRALNITGADRKLLLERAPDELYLDRRVRVWYQPLARWVNARITEPDSAHGLVEVIADEKVHDKLSYHDGRGLSIGRSSFDLDLLDPRDPRPKKHPLEDHPEIQDGALVRFGDRHGAVGYGYIDGIATDKGVFRVMDSLDRWPQLPFDTDAKFLAPNAVPKHRPSVRRGNKILLHDFPAQKQRVYEILGYDPETKTIIAKIVSRRPMGMSLVSTFRLDDDRLKILDGDLSALHEQHPALKTLREYTVRHHRIRFRAGDAVLEGKILTAKTLPAFVEVIIRKEPDERERGGDDYHRYDVRPEDIVSIKEPNGR
jgi:hypothetical protein